MQPKGTASGHLVEQSIIVSRKVDPSLHVGESSPWDGNFLLTKVLHMGHLALLQAMQCLLHSLMSRNSPGHTILLLTRSMVARAPG